MKADAIVTPVAAASAWLLAGVLIVCGVGTVAWVLLELMMEALR